MMGKKCAIITGASKGIGRAIALELAWQGYAIVANYMSSEMAAFSLKKDIIAAGGECVIYQGDVSNTGVAKGLVDLAVSTYGGVYILVNNAGITKDGLLAMMKEEDFDRVIDVNLKSVFNCTRYVSPIMIKQREGRIINISSVIGIMGNAGQTNYAASKAGILGFTKSVAKELGGRGITCNAIAPGFIQTEMTESLDEKVKSKMIDNIPLKKFGTETDIAKAAAFLVSDNAKYITGQVINVDGGMVM